MEPAVDAAFDIDPRAVIEPWPCIDLRPDAGTQSPNELSSATQPHWTAELDRLAEALSTGEPPPTAAMQLAAEPQPVAGSEPGDSSAAERIAEEVPRATRAATAFAADDLPAVASETEPPHIAWTDVETEPLADTSAHTSGEGHPSAAVGRGQVLVFTSPTPGAIEDAPVPRRTRPRVRWRRMAAVAATLVLVGAGGVRLATATLFRAPFSEGRASIESVPPGLEVCIDGTVRGVTPLTLSLPAGEHALEVRGRGLAQTLPLRVAAGALAYERLTWPASARTGAVRVESVPPGARVTVDGIPRGVTPVTVLGLSARTHSVVVEGPSGRAEQVVRVEPETTTDVRMAVFSGWLQVAARLDLQILEDGHVIGTSDVDRIVMPAGRHTIVLVNERYGFGESREITIEPGGVTRVAVDLPAGGVHVDAPAGYEVYLDGERVGTAPMPPTRRAARHPQRPRQGATR